MLLKEHDFIEDIAVKEEMEVVPGVYLKRLIFFFLNLAGVLKTVHHVGRKTDNMSAPARYPDSN